MSPLCRVLGSVAVTTLMLVASAASVDAQSSCEAGKLTLSGKRAACLLGVEAKAAKKALPPDPLKLQKCKDDFAAGFTKLDAKIGLGNPLDDCPAGGGDAAAIGNRIDVFVDDAVAALGNGDASPSKCAAEKEKVAGKKVYCKAKVIAAGVRQNTPPDGTNLTRCEQKFAAKFDELDARTGSGNPADACPAGTGDAGTIETKVDRLIAPLTVALAGGSACPFAYHFTATGDDTDRDFGWNGNYHDVPFTTGVGVAFGISCSTGVAPCGTCDLFGPITRAGEIAFPRRRCTDDPQRACSNDADCSGGSCVVYLGPPQPVGGGGISVCTLNHVPRPISGTLDPADGSSAFMLDLITRVYAGITHDDPCPKCVAGTCIGGPRSGLSCTVDGTSALYGEDMSFDCPPSPGALSATWLRHIPMSTGSQSVTLTSASPTCRALGFQALKCFCDTCDDANAAPCFTNADCTAVGAGICGGKRCIAGSSAGTPCTAQSECPGGACSVPGQATAPNQCGDGTCTPNTPPDDDSASEGVCADGPFEAYCSIQSYRACATDADCPAAGDACHLGRPRECFPDNGSIGASVSAAGVASPTAPTFAGLFCNPPAASVEINSAAGIPGLGRWTVPGSATIY